MCFRQRCEQYFTGDVTGALVLDLLGLCSHGVCDNITLTAPEVDIVVAERLHASKAVTTKSIRLIVVKLSGQSVIKKKGNVVNLEQRYPEDRNACQKCPG